MPTYLTDAEIERLISLAKEYEARAVKL